MTVDQLDYLAKRLDSYMDYRGFGEDLIDAEGGVFANGNYIAYQGDDPRLEELFTRREQEREMAMGGM